MKTKLTILFLLLATTLMAQELTLKSFTLDEQDLSARTNVVKDANGEACALVKVGLVVPNATFRGDVVQVKKQTSEYWVYLVDGATYIEIQAPGYHAFSYDFKEPLKKSCTYRLVLNVPQSTVAPVHSVSNTAYFILSTTPKDCEVYINGEFAGNAEDGLFQKRTTLGTALLYKVSKDLYHSAEGTVNVSEKQTRQSVNLQPAFGSVKVTSSPSGAKISLDGESVGTTPMVLQKIRSGNHTVKVVADKYAPAQKDITVSDNQQSDVSFNLSARFANITIKSLTGADIKVEGASRGNGSVTIQLMEGMYEVETSLAGHRPAKQQIEVVAGQDKRYTINPTPLYGSVAIESNPIGATITIGGKEYGTTPNVIDNLLVGSYDIKLSKQGCADYSGTFTISENRETAVNGFLAQGQQVHIVSDNVGDEIYVDGRKVGASPLDLALGLGPHQFYSVNSRGEKSYVRDLNVSINGNVGIVRLPFVTEIAGHKYVDLGLPSGTLWAICNVGASKPEDYGDYFAWGETTTKSSYDESNSNTNEKSIIDLYSSGIIDSNNNLTKSYDAAAKNWGGTWRMPTINEINELFNTDNCSWKWTEQNGVYGIRVTSKKYGNSIFLPAAGDRRQTSIDNHPLYGRYWSSTVSAHSWSKFALNLNFNSDGYYTNGYIRLSGQLVRSVSVDLKTTAYVQENQERTVNAIQKEGLFKGDVMTLEVNGVSFKMIPVKGGTFLMGGTSEQGSDANDDEKPVHKVTLCDYYIGQTEVTQALWQAVMGNNPSEVKGDNLPMSIYYDDCLAFINKLDSLTGKKFSLPTEAQWEYAARGGNKSKGYKYSGSNRLGDVAWDDNDIHAVATKSPNELGIYDMSGSVDEWCSDWFGAYNGFEQTNPTGPSCGDYYVLRGGCDGCGDEGQCRVSNRDYDEYNPEESHSIGLRLVLNP